MAAVRGGGGAGSLTAVVTGTGRGRRGIAGGLFALTALLGACVDEGRGTGATHGHGGDESAASSHGHGTPDDDGITPGECADVHEGHAGHQAMMWTAQMADEMTDAGCGWPYEPFLVTLDGGEDDPELDSPFEPRRYAEVWEAITAARLGLCSVATSIEAQDEGRAFGFTYQVGEPGCPGAVPTGSVRVGEYGTEAQRDAAAHTAARDADAERVYVLGRWVIELRGDAARLASTVADMGGQEPS